MIAIDPHPEHRETFTRNLAANNLSESKVERSFAYIGTGCRCQTLDSLLGKLEFPCFVKVDVDGGEVDVVSSARHSLIANDTRWIIETHSRELEDDCIEMLSAEGYFTVVIKNAGWRRLAPDHRPIKHNRWRVAWNKYSVLTVATRVRCGLD